MASDNTIPEKLAVGQRFTLGTWGEEPIEWRVLDVDGKGVLAVSECGLDCQKWNTSLRQHNDWESSDLKAWLTGTFLPGAFDDAARAKISDVILLSLDEVRRFFKDDCEDRRCRATRYAKAQGAWNGDEPGHSRAIIGCNWWLRSPGVEAGNAAGVYYHGTISAYGWSVDNTHNAVRPALRLEL